MTQGPTRRPSLDEFAREVTVALREAGFEGAIDHDRAKGRLALAGDRVIDLGPLHHQLADLSATDRLRNLATIAGMMTHPPTLPATWAEAKDLVLPHLRTQWSFVAADTEAHAVGKAEPTPRAPVTPHLAFELVVPFGPIRLTVTMAALERWGVAVDDAYRQGGENLRQKPAADWLGRKDAPGVYASGWADGFDASRLFLPRAFAGIPLRGRPVILAPSTERILVADAADADGLFQLARIARQMLERSKRFHFLRAVRMGDDGETWHDFMPPRDHPAYDPLRALRGAEEVRDATQHVDLVRRLAPPGHQVMPMPALHVLSSPLGETLTFTVWRAGKPTSLPLADAVILVNGDDVLGFAPWDALRKAAPGSLRAPQGYPPRAFAGDFPEAWQLGGLELKPWDGPLPG
ncbi:MAG: hypothetical protein U1E39_09570 [Planctomycetota bacterium]